MKALMIVALSVLLVSGCAALPSMVKPALEEEGEVFVYLQPFPPEAARLQFSIDHFSAVRSDGVEFPLPLSLAEFKHGEMRRQRLVVSGVLPPGLYQGLSCTVTKASLTGEGGEAALIVPEEPVKMNYAFTVQRRKAAVLHLVFRYDGSVQGGFNFTPVFSLFTPPVPTFGLVGYAVNPGGNTVTVFDKKSGEVASIIAMGRQPEGVAFDQTAGRAYVSLTGEDAIEIIDIKEGIFINRLNLKPGDGPREIALTPDGRFLLSVNAASRTLSIIDPGGPIELARIPLGEGPRSLLIAPNGLRCYVFNFFSNTISVIDIPNSATVATLSVDAGPLMGQFNRRGDRLYVICEGSPYLSVFDPSSLSLVKRMFEGPGLSVIKVDSASDLLYAYRRGDERLEVYDPFSLLPVHYLRATGGIVYMTIDGQENNLYAVSAEKNRLLSINLNTEKIVFETDVGGTPSRVTMMGER